MSKQKSPKMETRSKLGAPVQLIERRIYLIRGQKVLIDSDLAELYLVETRALIQAVKRNCERFPEDFMFQLTREEAQSLRSQIVISNFGARGGRRYLPHAFTEHGIAMLSSVLKSRRAIQMNILIIRAFVRLREMLSTHQDLAHKIEGLERQQKEHGQQLEAVYSILNKLMYAPTKPPKSIGFRIEK